MKTLRYKGVMGSGVRLEDGTICKPGVAVQVRDEIATALLEQQPENWAEVKTKPPKPTGGDSK